MSVLFDILKGVGNAADLPGSSVRDILARRNPLDQWMTPFGDQNRATGRDVLRTYGMAGEQDTGLNAAGGMATEMALDPLSWMGAGALFKALRGAGKAAGAVGTAGRAVQRTGLQQALAKSARPATAMSIASPVAGAYLMGDNEEQTPWKNWVGGALMAAPLAMGGVAMAKGLKAGANVKQAAAASEAIPATPELFNQEFVSAAGKTARPWKMTTTYKESLPVIKPGMKVVDYGSGPYQHVRGAVEQAGGTYVPFDRFGKIGSLDDIANADVVMASNVLNVQSKAANPRAAYESVLKELRDAMKPDGTLVANMPAHGPRSDWMTPKKLFEDLQELFEDVSRKGEVVIARKPKPPKSEGFPLMSVAPFAAAAGAGALSRILQDRREEGA